MEFVELTVDGAVALVRLDRPPVNALSEAVALELTEAFSRCRDASIRAVVVTGQPHFAAGADIKGFKETLDSGEKETTATALVGAVDALERLEKPTIAAVHGYALGGGCELSLGCDFRYMADDALIGQPEIALGLIPGAGGTQRLQRVIGFQKAKELVYTGRQVGAEEAARLGYADKIAPAGDLLDLALADASEWATRPTLALGAAKKALAAGLGHDLEAGMRVEMEGFHRSFASDDAIEGVKAFIEKRAPEFNGR